MLASAALTGKGPYGGVDQGYPEFGPGTPTNGEEVHIQEKSCSGPRSESTHSDHNTQRSFNPPPDPPHPRARGGGGSKSKILLEDHFLSPNDDFTKGLDIGYHTLGYSMQMTQKKGGIWRPHLLLI